MCGFKAVGEGAGYQIHFFSNLHSKITKKYAPTPNSKFSQPPPPSTTFPFWDFCLDSCMLDWDVNRVGHTNIKGGNAKKNQIHAIPRIRGHEKIVLVHIDWWWLSPWRRHQDRDFCYPILTAWWRTPLKLPNRVK